MQLLAENVVNAIHRLSQLHNTGSAQLLLSRISPHMLSCFHDSTIYPFEVAAWDAENWIFLADVCAYPSLPWRPSTPCRPRWNAIWLSSHGMQTTLDAILRISRVLAFLAILILLLSLNKENALLQTHSKFTHQHYIRMEQSKQVSKPNHHFHHCPVQTTPS